MAYAPETQNDRMQARLAPEIASGAVVVQQTPAGTLVSIPDSTLFAPGSGVLSAEGTRVLTYVIQALLEPTLLTIQVGDASDGPQGARAAAVADYFRDHSLANQLLPVVLPTAPVAVGAAGTPLQGTTIAVSVVSG
jgi:hypothetical protein